MILIYPEFVFFKHKPLNLFVIVPSSLDTLEDRLRQDKNTLNIIRKRINDKRLPPIPKLVLTVRQIIC